MTFAECVESARRQGEFTDEEAGSIIRRFDELIDRGLTAVEAKNSIIADMEASTRVQTARAKAMEALEAQGGNLADFTPVTTKRGSLYERLWGDIDDMAALDGSPIIDPAVAAEVFHQTVVSGRRAEIPDRVVAAAHDVLEPYSHLLTEGTRMGVLKSMERVVPDLDYVVATFVLTDGTELKLEGIYSKRFARVRAGYDPKEDALLFFRFGGVGVEGHERVLGDGVVGGRGANLLGRLPELGSNAGDILLRQRLAAIARLRRNFEDSLVGEFFHELTHLYLRWGIIDAGRFGLLLGHARKLRVLDTELNTYMQMIRRPESATGRPGLTLRDAYISHYEHRANRAAAIAEEYVAHLVERAWHGGFTGRELEPIRSLLEDIFTGYDGTMAQRLADLDENPRFATGGGRHGDEPGGAFAEAGEEAWDDTAIRSHLIMLAVERRKQRRVWRGDKVARGGDAAAQFAGEVDLNQRTFRKIAEMERKLLDEGKTVGEVAAELEARFGLPIEAEDIGKREVWWRLEDSVRRSGRLAGLSDEQQRQVAEAYATTIEIEPRLARFREIVGDPSAPLSRMQRLEGDLAARGLVTMRGPGGGVGGGWRRLHLSQDQERAFADAYHTVLPQEARLERLSNIVGKQVSGAFMRRLQRELAERGLIKLRQRGGPHGAMLAQMTSDEIAALTPDEMAVVLGRRPARVLTPDQEHKFAQAYAALPSKHDQLAQLRQIVGDSSIGMGTLRKVQRSLADRGVIDMRAPGAQPGGRLLRLTPEQEREFAETYRTIPSEAARLDRLREMTGGYGTPSSMRELQRDLAARGLLDLRAKGGAAGAAQAHLAKYVLPDQQGRAFAEVYASRLSRAHKLQQFREITGNLTAAASTMWRAVSDLRRRGIIPPAALPSRREEPRFALGADWQEDARVAARQRAVNEHLQWQLRLAEAEDLKREKAMAAIREGRDPLLEMRADAYQARELVALLESCRS